MTMVKWTIYLFIIQLLFSSTSMSEIANNPFNLEKPNIEGNAHGFPYDEAGLAVYVKVSTLTAVEMNNALKAFESIEVSNSEYTFGNVLGYKVYVSFSGWLITYLPKNSPAIAFTFATDGSVSNKLGRPINRVLSYINKKGEYKYYHFKYPDAKLMIIITKYSGSGSNNYLYIELPSEYTYFESSYSIYQKSLECKATLKVDGNEIVSLNTEYEIYDFFDINTTLVPDTVHKISLENSSSNCHNNHSKIAIIYNKF